jgi:putative N6-adenine-specific DNA methylase/tRNA (guanine6-N2)-methyltransferase
MGSSMDFLPFYRRVLEQTAEVLAPGGVLVILVLRNGPFNQALTDTGLFDVRHVRVLGIGGLYPRAFVLEKPAGDGADAE